MVPYQVYVRYLKENIDNKFVEDLLARLTQKMKQCNTTLKIKKVNHNDLKIAFKKLKNKNSTGSDGISQSQLLAGAPTLSNPLMEIFNLSITNGEFPKVWNIYKL